MKYFTLLTSALFLITGLVKSQTTPELIIQGHRGYNSSSQIIQANGLSFFVADNEENKGLELWKTDGTPEGTQRVKDIYPGSKNGCGYSMVSLNNFLYFYGIDSIHGGELWKTDGTDNGTVLVKEIYPGAGSSNIVNLININGTLFFNAFNGTKSGSELWKSDGTTEGTIIVKDIFPGSGSSSPLYFSEVNGFLYFTANNGTNGTELWRSDGTESGTLMVRDINPGASSTSILKIVNINGCAYFSASTSANGSELWKSDGTAAGTVMVKDINVGASSSYPSNITEFNGSIYFTINSGPNSQIWKSDGTESGTVFAFNTSFLSNLIKFNNQLFFVTNEGTNGLELWKSDGTPEGTLMAKDIYPGPYSGNPGNLTVMNGTLYFSATDDIYGTELWKSDGTGAGTIMFKELSPGKDSGSPSSISCVEEKLFFIKNIIGGFELWQSDGTENGTILLRSSLVGNVTRNGLYLLSMGDAVYWTATDGSYGLELWKSNNISTKMVKDIFPGSGGGTPTYTLNANKNLFFCATDGHKGFELWKTDSTEGAVMIKDIFPGTGHSQPTGLFLFNGLVYFLADNGINGIELWKTNGTEEGTVMVKDINPGSNSSSPSNFKVIGNSIFFSANDGINGTELWKTDGSENGTVLIKDFITGSVSGSPSSIVQSGNSVFMKSSNGINGIELWKCDTTGANMVMVKDIFTGANSSNPSSLTDINGTLFFTANNGTNGMELWKTDGTPEGTILVKDIFTGTNSSNPTKLINIRDKLLFWCNDGMHGNELWKSDGTNNGTVLLKEFFPGATGYIPNIITEIDSSLYYPTFENGTVSLGRIIKSDASTEGTSVVINNLPVIPNFIEPLGDYLYYLDNISSLWRFPYKQTIIFNTIPPKTIADSSFTVSAIGGPSGNPVIFESSDTTIAKCTGVNGSTIQILKTGICRIIANQAGNDQINASPTVEQLLIIDKANQKITFDSIPILNYGDTTIFLSARSSSGLPVSFQSSDTTVAKAINNQLIISGAGSAKIYAFQEGNYNFNAADTVKQSLGVLKANQIIIFDSIPTLNYGDTTIFLSARSSSGLPVSFQSADTTVATTFNNQLIIVGAGSAKIYAYQEGNNNFNAADTVKQPILVLKTNQTIYFDSIPNKSLNYTDFEIIARSSTGLPIIFTSSNFAVATISEGKIHIVGAGTSEICAIQEGNQNYYAVSACRTLRVSGTISLEAEDAALYRTIILSNQPGFSGTGFVNYQSHKTSFIEWTTNVTEAGLYDLKFKYSNDHRLRIASLIINDRTLISNWHFPFSGDSVWKTLKVTARLNKGINKIKLLSVNAVNLKIDNLTIEELNPENSSYNSELEKLLAKWIVNVYPNPVSDKFLTIIPSTAGEEIRVLLYDLKGKTLLDNKFVGINEGNNQIEVQVTSVPSGTYILKVITEKSIKSGIVIICR